MVLLTSIRNVAKRIPMIKFRKGGNQTTQATPAAAATAPASNTRHASSGPVIEDWQLPQRYQRRPIDDQEIAAINSGGAM
ncbi:unnamed protein product [Diamesa hyperborea]